MEPVNILNQFADSASDKNPESASNKNGDKQVSETTDLSECLKAEIEATKKQALRFRLLKNISKGVNFVKFEQSNDCPVKMAVKIFSEIERTNEPLTRRICRFIPIEYCCSPHPEEFKKLVEKTIPMHFSGLPVDDVVTWSIQFHRRSMDTIKQELAIEIIPKAVEECRGNGKHMVNINNPSIAVVVEVNPQFCGMSYIHHGNWARFKRFNLNMMCPTKNPQDKKQVKTDRENCEKVKSEKKQDLKELDKSEGNQDLKQLDKSEG
eukprot:GHVL01018933.1.p1 GENE.GHVL01018933.1~~GHVL01018933.1.p1  ORF type:complete len:265 (+),score=36.49 GHVL01018933.1:265-1059(+)